MGLLAAAAMPGLLPLPRVSAQSAAADWEKAAGGKMAFDTTSVKLNTSGPDAPRSENVPLGQGNFYSPTGGLFSAKNTALTQYITFAYKLTAEERESLEKQLPKWALEGRYDIEARAAGNPSKDQMRLMMQSLLASRFALSLHSETRTLPAYVLVLSKPGRMGPGLQLHPATAACSFDPKSSATETIDGKFPAACGAIQFMQPTVAGDLRAAGRTLSMKYMAAILPRVGNLDRPVVDETGISGAIDFAMEWEPQSQNPSATPQSEDTGTTFLEALQEQLGLQLKDTTAPVDVLVLDHIDEPTPN
jgi:uncharacterized protein (TIGR03435 family)